MRTFNPSFPISAAQLASLCDWAYYEDDAAVIQLTSLDDGTLYVVQGDESARINREGREIH